MRRSLLSSGPTLATLATALFPDKMAEQTRKRARLDSEELDLNVAVWRRMAGEEIASVVEHKRDEEFWYEDENIILVAGDTGFCVFKGILSHHSPVFRDMSSLPQPPNLAPSAERCPVVNLTDSPNELRYLLRACIPKNVEEYVQISLL